MDQQNQRPGQTPSASESQGLGQGLGQGPAQGQGQHESQTRLAESWQEIGRHISELFEKVSAAFRVAWAEERQGTTGATEEAKGLQNELRAVADRLERVMKRVAAETEQERSTTLEVTRDVSERTVSEARTAAISGLKTLNQQLDQLVKRLDREPDQPTPPAPPATGSTATGAEQPAGETGPSTATTPTSPQP